MSRARKGHSTMGVTSSRVSSLFVFLFISFLFITADNSTAQFFHFVQKAFLKRFISIQFRFDQRQFLRNFTTFKFNINLIFPDLKDPPSISRYDNDFIISLAQEIVQFVNIADDNLVTLAIV